MVKKNFFFVIEVFQISSIHWHKIGRWHRRRVRVARRRLDGILSHHFRHNLFLFHHRHLARYHTRSYHRRFWRTQRSIGTSQRESRGKNIIFLYMLKNNEKRILIFSYFKGELFHMWNRQRVL